MAQHLKWWNILEEDEQELLIQMLYKMSEDDLWKHNIMVDEKTDKYVERR